MAHCGTAVEPLHADRVGWCVTEVMQLILCGSCWLSFVWCQSLRCLNCSAPIFDPAVQGKSKLRESVLHFLQCQPSAQHSSLHSVRTHAALAQYMAAESKADNPSATCRFVSLQWLMRRRARTANWQRTDSRPPTGTHTSQLNLLSLPNRSSRQHQPASPSHSLPHSCHLLCPPPPLKNGCFLLLYNHSVSV